ncbi:dephospho-CoA kinase [Prochlorothrix hollandica]|uniref:Dephospho-CoA kinase n=1 Tax=Prochlorothrix hollandica PCC 9006 = CALU 1027 TaxID=317619 RepID=A0A0M2Q2T4_PROHO|nr:dephospho-CoA kinase [Prochlorothrix hollandica]KKJ01573.1 dephospho-CoA kinase [Prochlorothrix hollandica PCC 9006 = CALU 1027]
MGTPTTTPDSRRLIGLTGGIATGKTTVSSYLGTVHQLPILDADRYAREAVQPNSAILQRVVDRYGSDILADGEHLDRHKLANTVFHDETERHWLESQIHPYVNQCFLDVMAALHDQPTLVLVIPLLFEAGLTEQVSEIWVVACSEEQQRQRLMQRDQLNLEEAQARIESQMPLAEKCNRAQVVLDNSGDRDALLAQIDRALLSAPAPSVSIPSP